MKEEPKLPTPPQTPQRTVHKEELVTANSHYFRQSMSSDWIRLAMAYAAVSVVFWAYTTYQLSS
ncbi:hypothetical protein HDU91_002937, partial [Kappamyces sp. JEL0680]